MVIEIKQYANFWQSSFGMSSIKNSEQEKVSYFLDFSNNRTPDI